MAFVWPIIFPSTKKSSGNIAKSTILITRIIQEKDKWKRIAQKVKSMPNVLQQLFDQNLIKVLLEQCSVLTDCMFLSCHVRVSEWIHTL